MQALVLQEKNKIVLEDVSIAEELSPHSVRIAIQCVGICGSDIHYYLHGKIGSHIVKEPMILGHEASGIVTETGSEVTHLVPGDRVCMEPGIPDLMSKASKLGMYNLDPAVRFWATPPVHGCLRESVIHPAAFVFKIPDHVSFSEAAMVEPMAVGMHAARKANIGLGDVAVVLGAGTIGLLTTMAALIGGCSKVIVSDVLQPKLDIAEKFGAVRAVNITKENLEDVIKTETDGWGADIVFEASGNPSAINAVFSYVCPGGKVVFIGMPTGDANFDISAAQAKEAISIPIFRYAHMYPKTLALLASGRLNVKPLISKVFPFEQSVEAFELAASQPPEYVKIQISLDNR